MHSCCNLIGQCLINNRKTIESKDRQSRSRESSLFFYGGTRRHRKMAAYFCRVVQGGIVEKGLICAPKIVLFLSFETVLSKAVQLQQSSPVITGLDINVLEKWPQNRINK